MRYLYEAILIFKPKVRYKDINKFIKNILRHFYTEYKIKDYTLNKDLIKVVYEFTAGAKIKGNREPFDLLVGEKIDFISLDLKEKIVIKRKNYFEYLAECNTNNEKPVDYEDFKKEFFPEE